MADGDCATSLPGSTSAGSLWPVCTSGEDAVRVRPGVVVRGNGTPPGDSFGSSFESLSKDPLVGVMAREAELSLLVAPGRPVRGLMTSETNDCLRVMVASCSVTVVKGDTWDTEPRGDGREKFEGVRGREIGAWSKM